MAVKIVPIDANDQLIELTLDDATYFVHLSWNSTAGYWSIGLQDANSLDLVQGLSVVGNLPLLKRARRSTFPPGDIIAVAPKARPTIDYDALVSGDVLLIYLTASELAAMTQ